MIGKTISHYKIIEQIGSGGMGVVYKAEDTKLKRTVALKFLPQQLSSDPEAKERFIHEAQAASALDHPNICNIHEIGETDDGQSYIAMACYDGVSLRDRMSGVDDVGARHTVPISVDESINIAIQIARGLQKAHEKGIVHRDIKPANIHINEDGTVKILDFGLAKLAGQTRLTKTGSTVGTCYYMSPEQANGDEIDKRSDIWSLGVVLYEMVTGEVPFKGDYDQAVIYSILNEAPESMERVPAELKDIIEITLNKNKEERYQDLGEFIADLQTLINESGVSQRVIRHRQRLTKEKIIKAAKYGFYFLLFLAIVVTTYIISQIKPGGEIKPVPIAVISFKNLTGDPAYDYLEEAIPHMLITDLDQSKFYQVNTWDRMRDLLKQEGFPDSARIDVEVGSQLCSIDQIPTLISGSFTKMGDMFGIEFRILDTDTKKILNSGKSVGEGENSILRNQIDELSLQIAKARDIPEGEFVETKRPLTEIRTDNHEAYKYYFMGNKERSSLHWTGAKDNYAKAVSLDSTFAAAHMGLAYSYLYLGEREKKFKHLDLAMIFKNKLPYKEQLVLEYDYAILKRTNLSKIIDKMKQAISLYPKEKQLYFSVGQYYFYNKAELDSAINFYNKGLEIDPSDKWALARMGYIYAEKKEYQTAIEYLQRLVALEPNDWNPYDTMAEVYLAMNEHQKSIALYEKVLEAEPNDRAQAGIAANLIKMGEYDKARDQLNRGLKNYYYSLPIHLNIAIIDVAEGEIKHALNVLDDLEKLINPQDRLFVGNQFLIAEILFENGELQLAEERLALGKNIIEEADFTEGERDVLLLHYLSHVVCLEIKKGNVKEAKKYFDMYKKNIDKNIESSFKKVWLWQKWQYSLSGLIAYTEGKYDQAIDDLKRADGQDPWPNYWVSWAYQKQEPWTNYYLALSYQKIGDKTRAIEKFKSVINYNGFPSLIAEIYRRRAQEQLAVLKASE